MKGNVVNKMHLSREGMLHYPHFFGLISASGVRVVSVHRLLAWKEAGYWAPVWTLNFFCLLHYMFLSMIRVNPVPVNSLSFKTCANSCTKKKKNQTNFLNFLLTTSKLKINIFAWISLSNLGYPFIRADQAYMVYLAFTKSEKNLIVLNKIY